MSRLLEGRQLVESGRRAAPVGHSNRGLHRLDCDQLGHPVLSCRDATTALSKRRAPSARAAIALNIPCHFTNATGPWHESTLATGSTAFPICPRISVAFHGIFPCPWRRFLS